MATVLICVVLAALCVVGVKSIMKRSVSGCCGGGGDMVKKVKVKDKDLSNYPYKYKVDIDGMTCGNCKKRVENAFNEKEGCCCHVELSEKSGKIYSKAQLSESEILDTIIQIGYFPGKCEHIS